MINPHGPVPVARLTAAKVTVTACGFTTAEAEGAARGLRHILYGLSRAANDGIRFRPGIPPERRLRIADFTPEAGDDDLKPGLSTGATGAVSRQAFAVPAELVLPAYAMDRTLVGAVYGRSGADLTGPAVADVLATDIVVRWWWRPRPVLARLPARSLLPGSAVAGLAENALKVEAYAWANQPFVVVLAVVHAGGGTAAGFGAAAGPDVRTALRSAFLKAQTVRSMLGEAPKQWPTMPWPTTRALAAWHGGSAHLELLRDHAKESGEPGRETDWCEQAYRRFGHEPLIVSWYTPEGTVVKALCPGAAIYEQVAMRSDCPL